MSSAQSYPAQNWSRFARKWILLATVLVVALSAASSRMPLMAGAQAPAANQPADTDISPSALAQIDALLREKASRSNVERKISSQLLYAMRMAQGQAITSGVATLQISLPYTNNNKVVLDVTAAVSDSLLQQLGRLGAEVDGVSVRYRSIRLRADLAQIQAIAALPDVTFVRPRQDAMTDRLDGPAIGRSVADARRPGRFPLRPTLDRATLAAALQNAGQRARAVSDIGSRNSEGDTTHRAAFARSTYHVDGTGVKVGVLSDGVTNLAAAQASGDLGPVTVLAGQTGGGDEGTAMLEIIHDLAPGAQLYFATAFTSITSFAQNIINLRAAGCDIIVDDVGYFTETPFQDGQASGVTSNTNGGVVIQAIKTVTAAGALYFSSAGNAGNLNDGTAGVWEGNFVDGGPVGPPLSTLGETGQLHRFGALNYNTLTSTNPSRPITLFWSDPLGGAVNDYDLFRLDSTGSNLIDASADVQDGTQDPFEAISGGSVNERVVVVKFSGAGRFLHLNTNRGRLSLATSGQTHGHAGTNSPFAFGVAATPAPAAYPNPFSSSNKVETFSSDGFRRIFFNSNSTAITPGDFSATGGSLLAKPDLTAADGTTVTGAGGFPTPFYGTSAAAPHAAAIAALVKSAKVGLTQTQVRNALLSTAIDIEAAGFDRDSGVGIIMADRAVAAVVGTRTIRPGDFDGDGKTDVTVFRPSTGQWFVRQSSTLTLVTLVWGGGSDKPVPGDYDGDGISDIAVFRPSTGEWFVRQSSTLTLVTLIWGGGTDTPVQADYDGDGKTDIAIFRPTTGEWFIRQSSTLTLVTLIWGGGADKPVPGDYDGDGKTDVAIFRVSSGEWFIRPSTTLTLVSLVWGGGTDKPVPGDYDGDGKTDIAVFRPTTSEWFVLQSSTLTLVTLVWGGGTDIPVPGDYDGDGKIDIAIFRPTTGEWFIRQSTTLTLLTIVWGGGGDIPLPKLP